jgi:RNA polymerase sigma factor (sigma-70 family)
LKQKSEDNIASLIERCKKGEHNAFKEVYLLYSKAMFNICVRFLNNKEEAEDTLQESFIKAFKNIEQYKGEASFGAWLKRIVINKCLDALKKKNVRFVEMEDRDIIIVEEETEDNSVEYDAEAIKAAMKELPDGYRVILTLYLFEDHTHRMIAEKLNISEGTSKSQYARARKKLIQLITFIKASNER